MARRWRNWAYESAALDLALAQAGRPLHEVLGREPRPITYVNSLGLGDPPSADTILRRLERYPGLRFKLDAAVDVDAGDRRGAGRHRRRRTRSTSRATTGWRSRTEPRSPRSTSGCSRRSRTR